MTQEVCYWYLCFVPPETTTTIAPKIFGFAEFITALALLIVLYTIVDIRYRFRLSIAPGALHPVTFALIAIIGAVSLLSEVWIFQGWWLPKTVGLSKAIWQALFGALFLSMSLTWIYYAFISPPVFCKRNAKRFAQGLYHVVLKGNEAELAIIANELSRSAIPLVKYSRRLQPRFSYKDKVSEQDNKRKKPEVGDYAHDLLLLIANRKLCRHIVESSPVTALAIFESMSNEKKYDIPIGQFAKNVSTEAIANKDSILYHEGSGFSSGLIGYLKPWSQTIYGNFDLIEALAVNFGSPLDIDYRARWSWDAEQWKAYCRAISVAFAGFLTSGKSNIHSYAIFRAIHDVEDAFRDVYKLNEIGNELPKNDIYERLDVVVSFVTEAISLIDKQMTLPQVTELRRRDYNKEEDIYDLLADLMFKILFSASSVPGPPDKCWAIHYNATWSRFFDFMSKRKAVKIVQFKLRRLLYNEVARMTKMPNYKGARILGLLLNVMGTEVSTGKDGFGREYKPLAKAVHAWTKRSYLKIYDDLPDVAEAVLIGGISYDANERRLVKTYLKGLSKEASCQYLNLDHSLVSDIPLG